MKTKNGLAPLLALTAVVALTACQSASGWLRASEQGLVDGGKPPCPTDAGTCVEVSQAPALSGSCTNDRWLALLADPNRSCPVVGAVDGGAWDGSKLFGDPGDPPIPPGLQAYCVYEWAPSAPGNPANVAQLIARLGGPEVTSALERDCFVVGSSGSSAGVDAGWRTLQESFRQQTGWLAQLPPGQSAPAKVRVAVVDTAPTYYAAGEPGADRAGHGHAVGWIIRDHACPGTGGACTGQIADHLAMPRLSVRTRDLVHGGYFGSEGEVAKAVFGAVRTWNEFEAAGGNQPRLVLNLSLGWDSSWGGDPSNMPLGARATYAAIAHAVCQGALVIAAAGNDPGGPGVATGPMYPGGWETQPAPTAAQCLAIEGSSYTTGGAYPPLPPAGSTVYQPLVFAVSGVRANDRPLLNSRPGGRARLVAPGAHAVTADGPSPTDVIYGTSAATAVTSAIAAAVWGYRPKLTGPEVMEILRNSGTRLIPAADFCLGGRPCPRPFTDAQVVRVNLCEAVNKACSSGLESCPAASVLPACAPRPAYAGAPPRLTDASVASVQAAATTTYDASPVQWALAGLATCEDSVIVTTGPRYPASPCPKRQFFGTPIKPWSGPQPSTNPCPVCTIGQSSAASPEYTVTLSIDDEYTASELGDPVLRINGEYDVDLSGVGTLAAGDVAVIDNIDLSGVTVETAEIQFRLVDGSGTYSTESELITQ